MAFRFSFFPAGRAVLRPLQQDGGRDPRRGRPARTSCSRPIRPTSSKVELIRDAEHRCDALTHDTIQRLHRTFVTPFDREDLYALASALDNVMDAIDHAAVLVRLYKITKVLPGARELTRTVSGSAARLHDALEALERQEAGATARGRDQPARERSRPRVSESAADALRNGDRSDPDHQVEGSSSTCSSSSRTPARTSRT